MGFIGKVEGQQVLMAAPRFGGAFLLADKDDLLMEAILTPLPSNQLDLLGSALGEMPGGAYRVRAIIGWILEARNSSGSR